MEHRLVSGQARHPVGAIVVGAGPPGLAAATGAAHTGLKALGLDKLAPGGAPDAR